MKKSNLNKIVNKEKINDLKEKLVENSKSAWAFGLVTASDLSSQITQTENYRQFAEWAKEFSSEVSKAMDHTYLKLGPGAIDAETGQIFSASNHRILDGGHTLFESIKRASEIGNKNGWSGLQTFDEWRKAYFSDLSTTEGMPVFGSLTDNVYDFLRDVGFKDQDVRDFLMVNSKEAIEISETVLGGTLSAMSVFFAWKTQDKENFSRAVASLFAMSAVTSPITLIIAIVAMAIGYNTLVCHKAMARGAVLSFASLTVSALVPGPVILGVVPAIIVAIYLNKKMGKDLDVIDFGKRAFQYANSKEFRDKINESLEKIRSYKTSMAR